MGLHAVHQHSTRVRTNEPRGPQLASVRRVRDDRVRRATHEQITLIGTPDAAIETLTTLGRASDQYSVPDRQMRHRGSERLDGTDRGALRAFGGRFDGTLEADTSQPVPQLQLSGQLDGFDVVALMKASGSTGGVSGRLGGTVSLQASGTDPATLLRSGRGTIDAVISDGSIPGLDLVRTVVLAFGKPTGAPVEGSGTGFSRLGGRFAMAGGTLRSDNLAMASRDLDLAGTLTLNLETGALASRADVVLSRDLTAQAGTDLRRYAQEDGRVVVPATLGGTLERPSVSLDLASATRRAIGNELRRRTKSFLDGLLKKKDR
jgi:hypothetical protein